MTRRPVIAVVDDDELTRTWISEHITRAGYEVWEAGTGEEAARLVQECAPALLLLDLRLPDVDGIELLGRLRAIDRDLVIIMVTAYGEIELAVQAVKAGAHQFLQKPPDLDDLLITIDKALEARGLRRRLAVLQEQQSSQYEGLRLVGRSSALRELAAMVEKVARAESATVLLQGESGVGKDLTARAIHAQSSRREQAFLQINCTALPEHLVESELFGHERGAFTDARERKKGLAELADGGTLFLDEIGDMPVAAQGKLLGFLENSRFKRVGGTTDIVVDVRVIAATNQDLESEIAGHRFRSDLYYRLNVVPISIPPLRERRDDIIPLAEYFIDRLAGELRRPPPSLAPSAVDLLKAYGWPGNVRELRNVLERALILEDAAEIQPEHLPAEIRLSRASGTRPTAVVELPVDGIRLVDVEQDLIRQALARTEGNVTRAATLLGLTRDTLRYRLKKQEIDGAGTSPP